MKKTSVIFMPILSVFLVSACSESVDETIDLEQASSVAQDARTVAEDVEIPGINCINDENITYLCGPANAEDIIQIGNSEWLLVSGMNGELSGNSLNGKMHLVNHEDKSYETFFPGANPVIEQNMQDFANCPGPIDISNISVHGLSISSLDTGPEQYRVYITSHGEREAIEVFDVDAFLKPEIKWVGCIVMPDSSWTNSVTMLNDGGFYATQFMSAGSTGIENVLAGEITGHVFEWHPGSEVEVVSGTLMSGANGIVASDDERWLFVAAFGTNEIVRFDMSTTPIGKESISLSIAPDNIRWSSDGTLYTAGNLVSGGGWGVYEIDPESLEATLVSEVDESAAMGDASSALLVGNEIWVGTYSGDRLGILQKP